MEILRAKVDDPIEYVQRKRDLFSGKGFKSFGFKVKMYQLVDDQQTDPRPFLKQLHADGWGIIHLTRRDKFRHSMSNVVLEDRHRLGLGSQNKIEGQFIPKIYAPVSQLLNKIAQREGWLNDELEALTSLTRFDVAYEDLKDPVKQKQTLERLFRFLELRPFEATSPFKKVTPERWQDIVTNPEEIRQALKGTAYAPPE